jgi:hypothetical protein
MTTTTHELIPTMAPEAAVGGPAAVADGAPRGDRPAPAGRSAADDRSTPAGGPAADDRPAPAGQPAPDAVLVPDGACLGGVRAWRAAVRRRVGGGDVGMATAEYAIATVAAAGFAGLLIAILRSDEVRGLLLGIVRGALAV